MVSIMGETGSKTRPLTRIQPCAVCAAPVRTPAGTQAEYALVLPSEPTTIQRRKNVTTVVGPSPCYLVCDACVAANPRGVRAALDQRYGDGYAAWTSPKHLPPMLDEAATYLASHEAGECMDFGSWQKMQDWL
jgi:hypothetical protein